MAEVKEKLKITVFEDNTVIIEKDGKEMQGVSSFKLECKEALIPCTFTVVQDLISY